MIVPTDRPLRFCMITTFYPPFNFGGDGYYVYRLSNELAKRGHRVEIIHCIDSYRLLAGGKPSGRYDDHENIVVHGLESGAGFLSPFMTQQTGSPVFKAGRIRRILEAGFDVIHYHNVSLVGGPGILQYGNGIKLYSIHEHWLLCPTHVLFKFNREICIRKNCIPCTLWHRRPPQWWRYTSLLKDMVKHVDLFIAPSRFAKEKHEQIGFSVPTADIPCFAPFPEEEVHGSDDERDPERNSRPYFLFVGRLERIKGLQTLIPLFRRYKKASLLIAGTGSYKSRLRRLAEGADNIRFLGYQSGHKLWALYRNAVAVIVPSICYEMFGTVIVEAFTQKTPTIVRNLGGMPELVQSSGAGFVYDTDEDLIGAMGRLLENPSYRNRLGLLGYEAYQRNYTPDAHLKKYFELIHQVMTNSSRSSTH